MDHQLEGSWFPHCPRNASMEILNPEIAAQTLFLLQIQVYSAASLVLHTKCSWLSPTLVTVTQLEGMAQNCIR